MKKDKNERAIFRRFLDDVYTQKEAEQFMQSVQEYESGEPFNQLASETWEESAFETLTTDREREKYKKEARKLLNRIAHRKRTYWHRIVTVTASVAAMVVLILGGARYIHLSNVQDITYLEASTTYGERKQLTLADGTQLVLNSCSHVRYPQHFAKDCRSIELSGEAYFRVTKNEKAPFVVKTQRFDVRVLGTSFDVKSYADDEIISVSVESGKVQVDMPDAMMRLGAHEQVLINTVSEGYVKRYEETLVAAWVKGGLYFNSTPIRDVAKELERVYNCRITFASGQRFDNLISGEHDNKDLESVLKSIEYISHIKYKKDGRDILLYK